jgi:hypothetical protein
MNKCFDRLVGLKGVCNNTHNFYVNDLSGVSFRSFAEAANEEYNTGVRLFDTLYKTAVESVKTDVLSVSDFKANYMAKVGQIGSIGDYFVESENKYIQIVAKVDTDDPYVIGRINSIEFISDRDACTKIYIDGEPIDIVVNEGLNRIDINESFAFSKTISIDTSCFNIGSHSYDCGCYDNCKDCQDDCIKMSYYTGIDATNIEFQSNLGIRTYFGCECDMDKFLCPYAHLMKSAIRIKMGTLLMLEIISNKDNKSYFLRSNKSDAEFWLARWEGTTNLQTGFRERSEYWTEIKKIASQLKMQKSMCNSCKGILIKQIV